MVNTQEQKQKIKRLKIQRNIGYKRKSNYIVNTTIPYL